jgi:hypothetical protein
VQSDSGFSYSLCTFFTFAHLPGRDDCEFTNLDTTLEKRPALARCMLASIAHAIMVAHYPFCSEESLCESKTSFQEIGIGWVVE